jgi:hypothetical protein
MLVMQYAHRLPADYDMSRIEERARGRGPLWDATPGLGFKAFAARRRSAGAADNLYTSIYVWLEPAAALTFLSDDRFGAVVSSFGRPTIETWLPVDARVAASHSGVPKIIVRSAVDVDQASEMAAVRAQEAERNTRLLGMSGALAAVSAIDLERWRLVRFSVWPHPVADEPGSVAYDILHLARPGWAGLAQGASQRAA